MRARLKGHVHMMDRWQAGRRAPLAYAPTIPAEPGTRNAPPVPGAGHGRNGPSIPIRSRKAGRREGIFVKLLRYLRRETLGAWLLPLVIIASLASMHQAGLFQLLDLRFFDVVSTQQAGATPKVVVVEQDAAFEQGGTDRFAELDRALARLGVERIGYLGDRPTGIKAGTSKIPVVTARSPQPVPASQAWQLPPGQGDELVAARILPAAQYGIYRSQLPDLPGKAARLPVFETVMAGVAVPRAPYLICMPREQSIPTLSASQLIAGDLAQGDLAGTVAIVAGRSAFTNSYATPLTPQHQATSEARYRALAVQSLRSAGAVYQSTLWEVWLLMLIAGLVLALAYGRVDPKRFALALPLFATALIVPACWAALHFGGRLLPLTALLLAPWLVSFALVLLRESSQDRRLEAAASRAVQHSFRRSALREGARLPEFLGVAARIAGVERSLLVAVRPNGQLEEVQANNAALDDLALSHRQLATALGGMRRKGASFAAEEFLPQWPGQARVCWLGGAQGDLYWFYSQPVGSTPRKSAQLVRAIVASFRELFRWRSDLNARSHNDERFSPIDDKVASAIALIAQQSEQVRHGFDALDTAVVIFHLIGSPLHANARMQEIYQQAGLSVAETDLPHALLELTDLDETRIHAMLHDLLIHGGEMRVPMREIGPEERMIRVAAPHSLAKGEERVLVVEAIDVADFHRAADLRQAVAMYIDLQLRNDFEAILLGAELAADDRVGREQLGPIVRRIAETARRGTGRLDEVAELTRGSASQVVDASYPIEARKVVTEAVQRVSDFADELSVEIQAQIPGISGFTIAEPVRLREMIEAMLRVVIADTPQGEKVRLVLDEFDHHTRIRISGGFGIGFERLVNLLDAGPEKASGDYRAIAQGMEQSRQWNARYPIGGVRQTGLVSIWICGGLDEPVPHTDY